MKPNFTCKEYLRIARACVFNAGASGVCLCDKHYNHREEDEAVTSEAMMNEGFLVNRIGEVLFGPEWQSKLSEYLDINDRTIRRWRSGEMAVPIGVWKELFIKLDVAKENIEHIIREVRVKIDGG